MSSDAKAAQGWLVTVVVAVVVVGLVVLVAPYYSTQLWWVLREGLFWMIPLAIVAVLALSAAAAIDRGDSAAGGLGLLAAAALVGSLGWFGVHEYFQDRSYVSSVRVTNAPVPELQQRTPFNVSAAQVRPNLGDIPGDIQQTMYLPDDREFSTPVERRGSFTGYQTLLVQQISDTGRNIPSRCDFSGAADRRFGGLWSHSLARLINDGRRGVNWDDQDIYGYCDRGTPKIVVPLKEQDGVFVVTERPAGVAVYNGATGQVEFPPSTQGIPGPSYPLSLAETQRNSVGAISGFWDWVWNRSGWELPDEESSINSDNRGEFVVSTTAGDPVYATLLSGRGAATAISAISITDAHLQGEGDQLQPVVVHRTNPVWLSPTSITDRVRADFGDVFATQRDATIFELAPLGGNQWVVTIGLPQNMIYRVKGEGDLAQPPCLFNLDGKQLRCGPAANLGGNGPGVALGSSGVPGSAGQGLIPGVAPAPADSDLGKLSNQQLTDLINRANQESARRLETTGGGGH